MDVLHFFYTVPGSFLLPGLSHIFAGNVETVTGYSLRRNSYAVEVKIIEQNNC